MVHVGEKRRTWSLLIFIWIHQFLSKLLRIPGEIPGLWWPRKFSFFLRGGVNLYSEVLSVVKFNLFIFSMIQLEMAKHKLDASLVAQMVKNLPARQETWV